MLVIFLNITFVIVSLSTPGALPVGFPSFSSTLWPDLPGSTEVRVWQVNQGYGMKVHVPAGVDATLEAETWVWKGWQWNLA